MKASEHGVQAVCFSARSLPVHHVFHAGENPDIPTAFLQIYLRFVGMDNGPIDQFFQYPVIRNRIILRCIRFPVGMEKFLALRGDDARLSQRP
jgi:hypothetical protein